MAALDAASGSADAQGGAGDAVGLLAGNDHTGGLTATAQSVKVAYPGPTG